MRYVVYNIPYEDLKELNKEERIEYIKFKKHFDISDVDFDDKVNVLQKISDLVTEFEIENYMSFKQEGE